MTPDEVIDCYVADVARRLPGPKRNDVAYELGLLLREELRGRAGDTGRLPDEAMALELLRGFGHPAEVAERYRKPGVTFIKPSESRVFALLSLGGVALQWAVSLPAAFADLKPGEDQLVLLGRWWVSYGLAAFWWPGFLIVIAMISAWISQGAKIPPWKPRAVDRDSINRAAWILGIAAAGAGTAFLVMLPWAIDNVSNPNLAAALKFDPEFLAERAPVVLAFMLGHIALYVMLVIEGRWRKLTRWLDITISLIIGGILVWFIAAGPMFEAESADQIAKTAIGFLVLIIMLDVSFKVWREFARIRPPQAAKGH
ncbi:MAG TPA: hypothetical protein VFV70_09345 [Hyphomonadaceae bacterium]|nr:hypothetical protein [Hyphomonadaceae bacterium]